MKLLSIINEELNNFINEIADDDVVDSRTINLQQEYDKLNNELFNNALKINVPLIWKNMKGRLGVVASMTNRFTGDVKIEHLGISTFYKFTYKKFRNTLAHEMIHVLQLQTTGKADHGWSFHENARRINNMGLGYNITQKNEEEIGMSDDEQAKLDRNPLIGLIVNLDGRIGVISTTQGTFQKEKDTLFGFMDRLVNTIGKYRNIEVTVVQSPSPYLKNKMSITRTFRRGFGTAELPQEAIDDIMQKGKILSKHKFAKGTVPSQVSEDVSQPTDSSEWIYSEISMINNNKMKRNGRERLFEVMKRVDPTFKPKLNENVDTKQQLVNYFENQWSNNPAVIKAIQDDETLRDLYGVFLYYDYNDWNQMSERELTTLRATWASEEKRIGKGLLDKYGGKTMLSADDFGEPMQNEEIQSTQDKLIEKEKNKDYLPITTPAGSPDDKLFTDVVKQGIDSHLEGFTKSKFEIKNALDGNRRIFNFHRSEIPILLRRLEELGTPEALQWKEDIEQYKDTPVFN